MILFHQIWRKLAPNPRLLYFHPDIKHNKVGMIATANNKSNENGSQFYITLRDKIDYLDGCHTIFGVVSEECKSVLQKLNASIVGDENRPLQNIRVRHTRVLKDPLPDPPGLNKLIPPHSPPRVVDDEMKPFKDVEDEIQVLEQLAKTEAQSRSVTLEILGDLPSSEMKPPENILFVCKLNENTEDEDLELIFSRFGEIVSCEIIRDWKTGDSLQYAFIEFKEKKSCEEAYFKMQDCLIDDRRIHVDFCQSVSKQWNMFKAGAHRGPKKRSVGDLGPPERALDSKQPLTVMTKKAPVGKYAFVFAQPKD